jgi:hypothetical protein
MARRIPEHSLESPETIRDPDAARDVDISLVSLTEDREPDDALGMRTAVLYGQESPPSYAAAAAGGTIPPTAVLVDSGGCSIRAEYGGGCKGRKCGTGVQAASHTSPLVFTFL